MDIGIADVMLDKSKFMVLASAALLLLLTSNRVLDVEVQAEIKDDIDTDSFTGAPNLVASSMHMEALARAAFHGFRLSNVVALLGDELGYWVKPRSTTWFSRFLLDQYDEDRWVKMFKMNKASIFSLAELLKPSVQRKDTKYRLAIHVVVRVACTLFKLCSGASLLICSELFAMGRSTVSVLLRDVVHAINIVLRSKISWPQGDCLLQTEAHFRHLSGLLGVVGAIDGTQVSISKPRVGARDYYYFKSGGYSMNCQAVVDSRKRFLDLFLGMPRSTNGSHMLRRSSLFHKAMQQRLWDADVSFSGFSPYLVGDQGYPLMPWLLVPHRDSQNLPLADRLFNKKLRRSRTVVENAFGLLKQSFQELLVKSNLDVTFLPDVIVTCAILHNMLQGQSHEQIQQLLEVLRQEGLEPEALAEYGQLMQATEPLGDDDSFDRGGNKRRQIGVFLAVQRGIGG